MYRYVLTVSRHTNMLPHRDHAQANAITTMSCTSHSLAQDRKLTGVAIVENEAALCSSKNDGVLVSSIPTRYLAMTVAHLQSVVLHQLGSTRKVRSYE